MLLKRNTEATRRFIDKIFYLKVGLYFVNMGTTTYFIFINKEAGSSLQHAIFKIYAYLNYCIFINLSIF